MQTPTNTVQPAALEDTVVRLLARWRAETAFISSSSGRNEHPDYLHLISLGEVALPFLFRDLESTRDGHLSKALTAITGAHPVPPEARGKIDSIVEAWLQWARANGW
jgi:hypothetical protein